MTPLEADALEALAASNRRSLSAELREAIRRHFEQARGGLEK